jgi:cell division septation protein DedD
MADRFQDRPFPDPQADADPLAELARLIGQTDNGRGGQARQPGPPVEPEEPAISPGPPLWMQRANRQEIPRSQQQTPASGRDPFPEPPRMPSVQAFSAPGFPGGMQGHDDHGDDYADHGFESHEPQHEVRHQDTHRSFPDPEFADELAKLDFRVGEARHRFGDEAEADPRFHREPAFDEPAGGADPSRYDDALFGQLGPAQQDYQGEQDYQEEHFGYQDGYDEAEEEEAPKRRGGKVMVVVILALAVLGTGGAFAYRTYVSAGRSGEPPIIKADNSPTKIMASPADSSPKVPDRLLGGDGGEKLVSREETPVDPSRSIAGNGGGPRVVFPQLNQNSNPPSPTSVAPGGLASNNNGTLPNGDPRPIKTLSVTGNPADGATTAATPPKPAKVITAQPVVPRNSPVNANASANNAPMAITPQPAPAGRVAALEQPAAAPAAASGSGGYLVSISSQNSEAEAISSYQAVQAKYSSVLGSYSPVIRRVEPNGKIMYRAAVGPFSSREEANKMCGSLKAAGGQCFAFSN